MQETLKYGMCGNNFVTQIKRGHYAVSFVDNCDGCYSVAVGTMPDWDTPTLGINNLLNLTEFPFDVSSYTRNDYPDTLFIPYHELHSFMDKVRDIPPRPDFDTNRSIVVRLEEPLELTQKEAYSYLKAEWDTSANWDYPIFSAIWDELVRVDGATTFDRITRDFSKE